VSVAECSGGHQRYVTKFGISDTDRSLPLPSVVISTDGNNLKANFFITWNNNRPSTSCHATPFVELSSSFTVQKCGKDV
jgi:hypothetical protein